MIRIRRVSVTIIFIVIGLIILWMSTIYSLHDIWPHGFMTNRHYEYGITSGTVVEPLDLLARHQTPSEFVKVKDVIINHPVGVFPFHEPVKGTRFRFAVDSPAIGTKTLYLIDVKSVRMFAIDSGRFDLRGIGDGIGSKVPYVKDDGIAIAEDRVLLTHDNIYEKVEAIVDIKSRSIIDVRVIRK